MVVGYVPCSTKVLVEDILETHYPLRWTIAELVGEASRIRGRRVYVKNVVMELRRAGTVVEGRRTVKAGRMTREVVTVQWKEEQ